MVRPKLQALVYDILLPGAEGAGKRRSEFEYVLLEYNETPSTGL